MNSGSLTLKEQLWLEQIVQQYGKAQAIQSFSELDGLLSAVLSGPLAIEPDVWLVALWGGEKQIPKWKNERELTRFMNLAFQHLNDLADQLADFPQQYQPVYTLEDTDTHPPQAIGRWCAGYMRGVALTDWSALPDTLRPELALIEGQQQIIAVPSSSTDQNHLGEQVRRAALALHDYWLTQPEAHEVRQFPIVSAAKPGRNDPCPCGSGKKFKKCCGA